MGEGEEVCWGIGDVGVGIVEEAGGFGMMQTGGPKGWCEMAARGGGCSPANGELVCSSQVVPWVPAPVSGQGSRGGWGMMQLSVL